MGGAALGGVATYWAEHYLGAWLHAWWGFILGGAALRRGYILGGTVPGAEQCLGAWLHTQLGLVGLRFRQIPGFCKASALDPDADFRKPREVTSSVRGLFCCGFSR